jgi:glycosyltransferase involved in cell wall biosynthesis
MADVAILVPTHRHAELIPFALRSALAQEGPSIEVLVVGDGVEDATREALTPFLEDSRVRFFDHAKGARHGERLRHEALLQSSAPIVCYLSDDDLLLPAHTAQVVEMLREVDFVTGAPVNVWPDGSLRYNAFDLGRPEFRQVLLEGRGGGGLTGVAHTREVYERLPVGWRPAPADVPTDIHMWRQFVTLPGFAGATCKRLTSLVFPSVLRADMTTAERVAELARWERHLGDPAFPEELEHLVGLAARKAAERLKLTSLALEAELGRVQATRWWRARRTFAELKPVRALRTMRRGAR